MMILKKPKKYKKYLSYAQRERKRIEAKLSFIIFIKQTINNMFITVKNRKNKVILVKSSGSVGFKGTKKSGYFAATSLSKNVSFVLNKKMKRKYARVIILSKITKNMKLAIKNLKSKTLHVSEIIERIPIPHNGLRGSKIRRL